MKRFFICSFFAACCLQGYAQHVEGYWLSESKTGFFDGMDNMEMKIERSGDSLSGNVFYIWEHGVYYQNISLGGKAGATEGRLSLKEEQLVANRNGVFPNDCLGIFDLTYSTDGKKEYLTGMWVSPLPPKPAHVFRNVKKELHRCPDTKVVFYRVLNKEVRRPVSLVVAKPAERKLVTVKDQPKEVIAAAVPPVDADVERFKQFKARKDSTQLTVTYKNPLVKMELYDNGIVDNDMVSIFLGDSLVMKGYVLQTQPKIFELTLNRNSKKSLLYMFAENEGEIPPNTALLVMYVDDKRYEIRLSADLKTNAKVVFQALD